MIKTLGNWMAGFAIVAMTFSADAAEPISEPASVSDIALAPSGDLLGVVVDEQGQPVVNAPVQVMHQQSVIALVRTDAQGRYAVQGLRSGLHMVRTVNDQKLCRFWTPAMAPPSAGTGLLMVSRAAIVRGQNGCADGCGESVYYEGCGDCGEYCPKRRGLFGGLGGGIGGGALLPVVAFGAVAAVTIASTTGNDDRRPVGVQPPASP
jgi:hypothetical protein